jgi:Uma2 family endonuclease
MSREEYLALDRASDERWFLWDGEVFAMAGASIDHERIVANLVANIHSALGRGPCEILPSNVRTRIPGRDRYVYADAVIVCGEPALEDDRADTLLNPTVLFEVLSDSTEKFDRGEKFAGLRAIATLRAYVLVSQTTRRVEVYERGDVVETWTYRAYEGTTRASLDVAVPGLTLALEDVYLKTAIA